METALVEGLLGPVQAGCLGKDAPVTGDEESRGSVGVEKVQVWADRWAGVLGREREGEAGGPSNTIQLDAAGHCSAGCFPGQQPIAAGVFPTRLTPPPRFSSCPPPPPQQPQPPHRAHLRRLVFQSASATRRVLRSSMFCVPGSSISDCSSPSFRPSCLARAASGTLRCAAGGWMASGGVSKWVGLGWTDTMPNFVLWIHEGIRARQGTRREAHP